MLMLNFAIVGGSVIRRCKRAHHSVKWVRDLAMTKPHMAKNFYMSEAPRIKKVVVKNNFIYFVYNIYLQECPGEWIGPTLLSWPFQSARNLCRSASNEMCHVVVWLFVICLRSSFVSSLFFFSFFFARCFFFSSSFRESTFANISANKRYHFFGHRSDWVHSTQFEYKGTSETEMQMEIPRSLEY